MSAKSLKSITLHLASADEIRNMSHGEVTADTAYDDSGSPIKDGLFDPDIFGEDGRGFGHIELSYPVVHPWYEDAVKLLTSLDDLSDGQAVLDILQSTPSPLTGASGNNGSPSPSPLAGEGRGEGDAVVQLVHGRGEGASFAHRCLAAMRKSGIKPETLVMKAISVVPPMMRPFVQARGGAILSSDLNEQYRKVISRNNSLRELLAKTGGKAPVAYLKDARERLTEAVRSLIGDSYDSALQSLTNLVTDDNGFLKRNLTGKRQDYSGRSVIVSGPDLKLTQCGLPYEMALVQFEPFIARKLVENGAAESVMEALEKIAQEPDSKEVRRASEQVVAEKVVLLNRAPTLQRLAIQPFQPVLVDHRAIALHPLVCYGFNADFDGDQMAVHVPISGSAQAEAHALLDSAVNLVSPSNGSPVAGPVQDIVLGLWYLTSSTSPLVGEGGGEDSFSPSPLAGEGRGEGANSQFSSALDLINHIQSGDIHPHAPVILSDKEFSGVEKIETTAGRVLFNANLPRELRFVNQRMDRSELQNLVAQCLVKCGRQRTLEMLDNLNRIGFEYVTRYAPSFGLGTVPDSRIVAPIMENARKQEKSLYNDFSSGKVDSRTHYSGVREIWWNAALQAREAIEANLADMNNGLNPILAAKTSGARGSAASLSATFGIQGSLWRELGEGPVFEAGVASNFWQGISPLEHFARTFGARKGLIDNATRTMVDFPLLKNLIFAEQGITITSEDCGDNKGIEVSRIDWECSPMESLAQRIKGRVAIESIKDSKGKVIVEAGEMISREQAEMIDAAGIEKARIRSPFTCACEDGVCAKCYGEDLAYGRMVEKGASVGVIAAEAIADPIVQLTFRTFYYVPPPGEPVMPHHPGGLADTIDLFDGKYPDLSPAQFIERLQCILRYQGVDVNDKHFELIARKMYSFTRIEDPGDTLLLPGEIMTRDMLVAENEHVIESGGKPAAGSPVVLGAGEAAKKSSSVIGSAAVGDTRDILALAALKGAKDDFHNTLERIVAGLA